MSAIVLSNTRLTRWNKPLDRHCGTDATCSSPACFKPEKDAYTLTFKADKALRSRSCVCGYVAGADVETPAAPIGIQLLPRTRSWIFRALLCDIPINLDANLSAKLQTIPGPPRVKQDHKLLAKELGKRFRFKHTFTLSTCASTSAESTRPAMYMPQSTLGRQSTSGQPPIPSSIHYPPTHPASFSKGRDNGGRGDKGMGVRCAGE